MDGEAMMANVLEADAPKYQKWRKVIKTTDRWIDRCLTVLLLIILLIGVWFAYDSYYVFSGAKLGKMASFKPTGRHDAGIMKNLSKDVVAWLEIYDTTIDYPIVQGRDNNEYLNKNAYGEFSLSGAIFLDSANKEDFSDPYNLVYGHHMAGGYMFGALDSFMKESYFDSHTKGKLITPDGVIYELTIFAFLQTDASKEVIFDITSKGNRLDFIRRNSEQFKEPDSDHILALSTCKSPLTTDRMILFAAMTLVEEETDTTE